MKCEICGDEILGYKLGKHLLNLHNIQPQDYYNAYLKKNKEGLCEKCGQPTPFMNVSAGYKKYCNKCSPRLTCAICGFNFKTSNHLKLHNISAKEYYDTYLKQDGDGYCLTCNKPTKFISVFNGYAKHCNDSCAIKDSNIQSKIKCTTKEKYGVDNVFQSPEIQEKSKQTCQQKYGCDYHVQSDDFKAKSKQTKKIKYGNENYVNGNKISNTLLSHTKEQKEKHTQNIKKSKLLNHGNENYVNIEQARQTNLKKYGVDWVLDAPEVQEKIKTTMQNKYGVDNIFQSKEIRQKIKNGFVEKYGVDSPNKLPEIKEKANQTFKENYKRNTQLDNEINDADE